MPFGKNAVIFGATGLVGSHVLELLVDSYVSVVAPTRRPLANRASNVLNPIIRFDSSDSLNLPQESHVFFCLGTTRKKAGSGKAFEKTEKDLANYCFEAAKSSGSQHVFLLSSQGASHRSGILYLRVKGAIEYQFAGGPFSTVVVFRPSLLIGARSEGRFFEGLSQALAKPVMPLLQAMVSGFAPIEAKQVAEAMVFAARDQEKGRRVFENADLLNLSKTFQNS